MFRQFTRVPLEMTGGLRQQFDKVQAVNTKLHVRVARERKFVLGELEKLAAVCGYCEKEYEFYNHVYKNAPKKAYMSGMFGVYTLDKRGGKKVPTLTAQCTHGGEPFNLSQIVNMHKLGHEVESGPLQDMVHLLATGAKLVHPENPCVAVLRRHGAEVTWRIAADVAGLGNALELMGVKFCSFDSHDLAAATLDDNNDLVVRGNKISVVIPRLDENHPTGINWPLGTELGQRFKDEFATHTKIELSTAIQFASIWHRLGIKRYISHELGQPGVMERFISEEDAAILRTAWPQSWALDDPKDCEAVRQMLAEDPTSLIAKNKHRPRTQSDWTQRRLDIGEIKDDKAEIEAIMADPVRNNAYHAYRRIVYNQHDTTIIDKQDRYTFNGDAVSEVTVYSQYLNDIDGKVLIDQNSGIGVRTRNVDRTHPTGHKFNFGALSSCKIVNGREDWDWWSATGSDIKGTAVFAN